jgi:hypothetical protein
LRRFVQARQVSNVSPEILGPFERGGMRFIRKISICIDENGRSEKALVCMDMPLPLFSIKNRSLNRDAEQDFVVHSEMFADAFQVLRDGSAWDERLRGYEWPETIGIADDIRVASNARPLLSAPNAADFRRLFKDYVFDMTP